MRYWKGVCKMRKFALFLAVAMLLSCLAGCNPAVDPTNPTPSAPAPTDPAPTDPTDAPTDPADPTAAPTDPAPTDPPATDPAPTDPPATDPAPTDPPATDPAPTDPPALTDPVEEPSFLPGPTLVDKYGDTITSDEVDLRQMVVDYMYAMANIKWTAGIRLDYSSYASKSLIYEPGQTYLGMVYNNNQNGFEAFLDVLDENNNHIGTQAGWGTAPGNSCATSIRHAWQQISPTTNYEYSADMLPYFTSTGILALGNIDWSGYSDNNTDTIVQKHDAQVIFQAYALTLPGDALVRFLGTGGHALMVTKNPTVVYNADGTIDMDNSYVYLTDQNNRLHTRREYPSSWEVDRAVSFASALKDGYLPVTNAELQSGTTPTPTFELTMKPTVSAVQNGTVKGTVKSNHYINTVRMEVFSGDTVVASAQTHPYLKTCGFSTLGKQLKISELPAGKYKLVITAEVAFGTQTLVVMEFVRGDATTTSSSATAQQSAVSRARAVMELAWKEDKRIVCTL